jgi:hypothetical protein
MSDDAQPKPAKASSLTRRVTIYAVLLLVAFLFGLVPMLFKYRECSARLSETEQQLSLARRQSSLASAVIDARRGDYEPARQAASDFFTSLRTETDRGKESALSQVQREGVQALFNQRDEIITTLLARRDPAGLDRLSDLHVSYREIMNR